MGRYTNYSYLGVSFWGCASLFEGGRRRIGGFCKVERKSWFRSVVDIYEGVLSRTSIASRLSSLTLASC